MTNPDVLIVGAGPTGMTAAIELRRAGLSVRIIDRADHMAQHSQALVVQARTLELLQRYGLAEKAVAAGRRLQGGRLYSNGRQIAHVQVSNIPGRYPFVLFLPQTETERLLNEHMESLDVVTERQTELTVLSQGAGEVFATLRHSDGSTEELRTRWLIGCDGAHSAVRSMCDIAFEGEGVDLFFFLGDLEIEGHDAPSEELAVHLHHGNVVFMGRLTDKYTRLIVALHEDQKRDENAPITLEDFQKAIDQSGVKVRVLSADWITPFRVNDRQAAHYRSGNIFLAGDASHIHSPVGGQGMNTGMQDAANLGWKIAAVARGAPDSLLDSYQQERGAVGKRLLSFTSRALKMATTENSLLEGLRNAILPLVTQLSPVQKAATGFISETAIEYRHSPAVTDRGGDGDLRAGDRMPDLPLGRARSLLEAWTSPHHLAVLCGASKKDVEEFRQQLPAADIFAIDAAQLDAAGVKAIGQDPKVLLIRPDGYIGFRGPLDQPEAWAGYARRVGIVIA
ncbi:FAD-dependent monooxygenase [Silvibacterium acidisoli]|uniref:FAD-dependent monooxygenase n=1 Tax=Acidobacteriaceae bacterium ZG23-2 TaxID=2883246 RepID=UPI00406C7153